MSLLWQASAPKALAGLLIIIVVGCLSLSGPARADDYYAWAVGDTDVHPPTTELRCPGGMFITRIDGNEDEWLSNIQIYCTLPDTPTGQHHDANAGPEAGGNSGHRFMLNCGYSVVDGLTGLLTKVLRNYNVVAPPEVYAADLHAYCGKLNAPSQSVQSDMSFKRSGDVQVSYREMNEVYPDPGLQEHFHCPTNWGATGLWYSLGNVKHDDIAAVGLICAPLPGGAAPETPTAENPPSSPLTNAMTSVLPNAKGVQVASGTYGASCGQPEGNVTAALAKQCNGTTDCQYVVDYTVIGDPAPGCKKDYVAKWTCTGGEGERSARAEAEAGLRSIVELKCP